MERRGRTALLISTAACLGVVGGVCTGYLVQAQRTPTPLPSLSQAVIPQAEGGAAEPLSAAQDRRVKTDGDLRKLLLERPKGARDRPKGWRGDASWVSLSAYADTFVDPSGAFAGAVGKGFRRAVSIGWAEGENRDVRVNLLQYDQSGDTVGAAGDASDGQDWAGGQKDTRSWPIPGSSDQSGRVFVHDTPDRKPGYLPLYSAEAHAWRGDLYAVIYVYDSKPISKATIMSLAQRQVGKL